jgi:putative sigma-54 modulation protein
MGMLPLKHYFNKSFNFKQRVRMKLQVHSIHFDADMKLLEFIQSKLNKLDTFYDRITGGEVFLKLDKGDTKKVRSKMLEVKINLPGATLFVREQGKTFEEAMDIAIEALKVQLKRFKEKIQEKANPTRDVLLTMAMDS